MIRERGAHYLLCVKGNHSKPRDSLVLVDVDLRGTQSSNSTKESTINDRGSTKCVDAAIDRLYKLED